jgi:DNA-binding NarL/FixJ family response regulator
MQDKEIANALGIAQGTVHTHWTNVYGKLGVSCRRDALSKYLESCLRVCGPNERG